MAWSVCAVAETYKPQQVALLGPLFQKKPDWVSREIIRLSAIIPSASGQKIAERLFRFGLWWLGMKHQRSGQEITRGPVKPL